MTKYRVQNLLRSPLGLCNIQCGFLGDIDREKGKAELTPGATQDV